MNIKMVSKLTNFKYLNLFSVKYEDKQKIEKDWIVASRSSKIAQKNDQVENSSNLPDAVVVVPFHTGLEKLVMIKEFRVALADYQYGFPAGLLDHGETVRLAGKRELREETGLTLTKVIKESPSIYSSSGMTDESISMLFVECEGDPTNVFTEDSEDIEVLMLSQKDAVHLLEKDHEKFDVKSWLVLNTFAAHGIL